MAAFLRRQLTLSLATLAFLLLSSVSALGFTPPRQFSKYISRILCITIYIYTWSFGFKLIPTCTVKQVMGWSEWWLGGDSVGRGHRRRRADPSAGGACLARRCTCRFNREWVCHWSIIQKHGDASVGTSFSCLRRYILEKIILIIISVVCSVDKIKLKKTNCWMTD